MYMTGIIIVFLATEVVFGFVFVIDFDCTMNLTKKNYDTFKFERAQQHLHK